jgi:ABC-type Fe3+/spermidine/putrescine transport system ATPase subunit
MTSIRIVDLEKRFGEVKALSNVNLTIEKGEFFTLLGPSGCGKTTLLRTIAGFYRQDRGEVWLGDERVDDLPAYKRDTGMVFQNYAVFPHMTVFENVAYGLKVRKLPKAEIERRVEAALRTVHLDGFGKRTPDQLSGGQQQRVGLARAMAIEPRVLLFDEPLSNLDAKLRVEMRDEIRAVQKDLGITAVYVTHDQEEALVISDRIAVVSGGRIQQVGTPWEVYKDPANLFVASFVGKVNLLDA